MIEPTQSDVTTVREIVGWSFALVASVAGGLIALLRKKSKLRVDLAHDGDEVKMIERKNNRISYLEGEVAKAYNERNAAMRELGSLTSSVESLKTMNAQMQEEMHAAARERNRLMEIVLETKVMTKQGVDAAQAAYHEANNINVKIATLTKAGLDNDILRKTEAKVMLGEQDAQLKEINTVGNDTNARVKKMEDNSKAEDAKK